MEVSEVKATVGKRLAWVGAASSAVAVLDIVALVLILKFWVDVELYGIATVVVTLFAALELVAELGLTAAIIQRPEHNHQQLSTIYWMSILLSLLIYACVFVSAPYLADLHGHAIIEDMFKVFGINLVIRGAYAVPHAQLKRSLKFREISLARIVSNIADFGFKVGFAAAGFGVWCFVVGHLARGFVFFIGVMVAQPFRPALVFKPQEAKEDLVFGARSAAGEILYQVYSNLDYQVVNIFFGSVAVGLYRAAYELVLEPVRFVSGVVVAVAFPAFSRVKHELSAVMDLFVTFTKQNLVVVLSLIALIMISSEDMLGLFFREEYRSAANAARLLAGVGLLRALSTLGPPLLEGLGRPDLSARYQGTAAAVLSACFFGCAYAFGDDMGYGSVALAWAMGYPIAFVLLMSMVFRVAKMNFYEYLRRISRIPIAIGIAAAAAFGVHTVLGAQPPGLRLGAVVVTLALVEYLTLLTIAGIRLGKATR
jgi:O-antigen/teichoic acid export membrane protein